MQLFASIPPRLALHGGNQYYGLLPDGAGAMVRKAGAAAPNMRSPSTVEALVAAMVLKSAGTSH